MTHTAPVDPGMLDSRYGRRPRTTRRPLVIGVIVVTLIVAIALVAWWAWDDSQQAPEPENIGYSVTDRYNATVTGAVTPDAERAQRCAVEIRNREQAVVGYTEVDVPPDPSGQLKRITVDLRTTQEANAGMFTGCWYS